LICARVLIADEAQDHQYNSVHDVVVERKHRAAEQRVVDEPDTDPKAEHIGEQLDEAAPGLGAGLACHPCRPASEKTGDEEELPDRRFLIGNALQDDVSWDQWCPPSRYAARTSGLASSSLPVPLIVTLPLTMT